MSKHTSAPWKAHPIEINHGLPYTPVSAKTLLAKVYSEAFGDHAESEANARLVAAAPDLLDALQELVEIVEDAIAQKSAKDLDSFTLQPALHAIAKATGGSDGKY